MSRHMHLMVLLLVLAVLGHVAHADMHTAKLHFRVLWNGGEPIVLGHSGLLRIPCNGTLVYAMRLIIVLEDEGEAEINVDVRRLPVMIRELHRVALRPVCDSTSSIPFYAGSCKSVMLTSGLWRGHRIYTLIVVLEGQGWRVDEVAIDIRSTVDFRLATSPSELFDLEFRPFRRSILVVTREMFLPVVEEWARLKELEGFKVYIATLEKICSIVLTGKDLQDAIRRYVRYLYASDPSIEYLLLIGDASGVYYNSTITCKDLNRLPPWEVPTRYLYNSLPRGDVGHSDGFVPSDWYYGALDGTWDADRDGIYGEYPDDASEIDLYPEIIVARIPVRTLADAEKALLSNTWREFPYTLNLVASIVAYPDEHGLQIRGDTKLEVIYDLVYSRFSSWLDAYRLYEHYPAEKPITSPEDLNGNISRSNVVQLLGVSKGLTLIEGHGSPSCIYRLIWVEDRDGDGVADSDELASEPFLCASDVLEVGAPRIVFAVSCLAAYYDDPGGEISLGESIALNGGVYVGWARVTYACALPPEDELNPSNWCLAEHVLYAFSSKLVEGGVAHEVGEAVLYAILDLVTSEYPSEGAYALRIYYALEVLGDPTIGVYTDPARFEPQFVTAKAGTGTVELVLQTPRGPIPNAYVYVFDYQGGYEVSEYYWVLRSDENGKVAVPVPDYQTARLVYYPGSRSLPGASTPAIALVNISVTTWLVVKPTPIQPGAWFSITGCGFTPYMVYRVMIESRQVGLVRANATGCIDTKVLAPLDLPPNTVKLWLATFQTLTPVYELEVGVAKSPVHATYDKLITMESILNAVRDELKDVLRLISDIETLVKEHNESMTSMLESRLQSLYEKLIELNDTVARLELLLVNNTRSIREDVSVVLDAVEKVGEATQNTLQRLEALGVNTSRLMLLSSEILERIRSLKQALEEYSSRVLETLASMLKRSAVITEKLESIANQIATLSRLVDEGLNAAREANRKLEYLNATIMSVILPRIREVRGEIEDVKTEVTLLSKSLSRLQSRIAVVEEKLVELNESIGKRMDKNLNMMFAKIREVEDQLERAISSEVSNLSSRVERLSQLMLAVLEATVLGVGIAILVSVRRGLGGA